MASPSTLAASAKVREGESADGRRRSSRTFAPSRSRTLFRTLALFVLCLTPLAVLLYEFAVGRLVDPIEQITHRTGWWALALLIATLAVTPVRRLTGWNGVAKYRRPIGLFAFFYACLHVLTYFGLDQWLAWGYIVEDVVERPYITVGFTAWLLLIPLAVTSTRGWIRRLGRRWQRLHRLVYVSAALGVLHFLWLVKADTRQPLLFGLVLAILLTLRVPVVQGALRRLAPGR